jgi:hypothetical protein
MNIHDFHVHSCETSRAQIANWVLDLHPKTTKTNTKAIESLICTLWLRDNREQSELQRPNKFYNFHFKTIGRHEIINSDTNTYAIFFFLVNFLRALRVYDSLCPLRYFMAFLQLGFASLSLRLLQPSCVLSCFLSHWTWISMRCVKWNSEVSWCV